MTDVPVKRGRGRPRTDEAAALVRVNVRLPVAVEAAIRRVTAARKDGGDMADTHRALLVDALERMGEL